MKPAGREPRPAVSPPVSAAGGLVEAWSHAWREPGFARDILLWVPLLVATVLLYTTFLRYNEMRVGRPFADPLFSILPVRDVSALTFSFTYSFSILGGYRLLLAPRKGLMGIQAYILVSFARMLSMQLLPLEPAASMIPLQDPFVKFIVGIDSELRKDLFFSGHLATVCLFYFLEEQRAWKAVFLAGCVGVASCLAWQHVHYSIDLLAAPVVAYAACRTVSALHPRRPGFPVTPDAARQR